MDNLRQLREERAESITANETLVNVAEKESRNLTEDEVVEFELREEEIEALEARIKLAEKVEARKAAAAAGAGVSKKEPKEVQNFSFRNYINDIITTKGNLTGYSAEVNQEARNGEAGNQINGHGVPFSMLKRDSTAETAGEGGNTFGITVVPDFITALRDKTVLAGAGAQFLTGLTDKLAIPRQTALPTFAWAAENGTAAETDITWDQVSLAPERLTGTLDLSKQLIVQSGFDVEKFIVGEMTAGVARAFDYAGLNGSGASNQPLGVVGETNVNDVDLGANGAALTWANVVDLEKQVDMDNALDNGGAYITSAKVKGHLKTVKKDAGSGIYLMDDVYGEMLNGYKVHCTNAVLDNISKGSGTNLSQIFFGDWSKVIMAQWGGLDIVIDPYSKATTGLVPITISMFADVAVRHGQYFSFSNEVDAS